MGRWEPNARDRLARAALELFGERGYEQTTVAEIARRAGLTERTYFRHYADKREVLFGGSQVLRDRFTGAVAEAPASAAPIDVVAAGLEAIAEVFPAREDSRRRQSVVGAHPELQERELIKLATLSAAVAEALRARGVPDPTAGLAAEAGVAVLKIGYERWIAPTEHRDLADLLRESLTQLKAVTAGAEEPVATSGS
ncbi:TetR family transcriptional regulator [Streptomyces sp. MBT97]|uniref:TetR/AcrR family transcriptional regulator n=1 Tax=Streptomyces sp. MBT97 TaxID=2800411 RepID=UPI00190AFEBB|nr:TetR/AcrR family transcriptional regulator [Streptomyces sp. MBT97]MBK3635721.1 TetR family transcriptional regulator [Streptomyces sp. MBT97]